MVADVAVSVLELQCCLVLHHYFPSEIHLSMKQYYAEAKQTVEQLKADYTLLGEMRFMSESQNIPADVIVRHDRQAT